MAVRLGVVTFVFGAAAGMSVMRAAAPFRNGGPTVIEWLDVFGWSFCAVLCAFWAIMLSKIYSGEW